MISFLPFSIVVRTLFEETMGFFHKFHEQNKFVRSLNSMFLVLIPRKGL